MRKILALLLVLTLVFGSGYNSYAGKNTSIHLKTGNYSNLNALSFYVYISGHHGTQKTGVIEHVMLSLDTDPPSSEPATKLTMRTTGESGQFTSTDLELDAKPRIIYFEINGYKYYVGTHIIDIGKEGGGTMNYKVTALPSFKVSYNANGGTGEVPAEPTDYMAGTTVNVLGNTKNITKEDYLFTGWNTAANGSGSAYVGGNSFVMGFADVVLYAQWTPLYKIIYDGNTNDGGTAPTDLNAYKTGDAATVATKGTLTKIDHTFGGWMTASDGTGSDVTESSQIIIANADVILYAKWVRIPTFTVNYDKNAVDAVGVVPVDKVPYKTGVSVKVLDNVDLTYPGYTFKGWSTASNGSAGLLVGGSTFSMGTSEVTLYAQWSLDQVESTYTLYYDANGGTVVVPEKVELLKTGDSPQVGSPSSYSYSNFHFTGWNTSSKGDGTDYASESFITMGTCDITLYAQWKPFYVVNYDGNGNTEGTVPNDDNEYYSGTEVTVLYSQGLSKTHNTFGGWNKKADGSGPTYTTTFAMGNENVTLYAKWNPDLTYNVLYNENGATGGTVPVDSTEYFAGDKPTVLGNTGILSVTGYSFNGWNTAANGSGTAYNTSEQLTIGTSDIILYAQWSLVPPPPPSSTETPTNPSPTTETPTNPPTTQAPTNPTTVPTTEGETEELTNEPIPLGPSTPFNIDEPLASSTFEEVIEIEPEEIPLADALPQTGQLPVELFYGIGGLITAVGVFLKKK